MKLTLKVILDRFEDSGFQKDQDQCGVEQRNSQISKQITPGIFPLLVGKHLLCAFVHQNEPEDISEPVADDQAEFESGPIKEAGEPGKRQRQRQVDYKVIPPGKG